MAQIKCIDVSEWQGKVDFKKVKAAGYSHAILRAGFGRSSTQVDAEFERNYKNAKAAGVKVGVYWYAYAVDKADAVKEAKACLDVLKGKTLELPVFYDMEESSMKSLGKAALTAMATAFCEEIKKGGFRCGVYGNPDWFTNYLDYKTLKSKYPIWLAQYYKEAELECDIWQYTSEGKVSGISGNVDLNIIYNEEVIKTANTAPSADAESSKEELRSGDSGIDVLCFKYLIQIADDMGVIDYGMTLGNNRFSAGTQDAVKALQKIMGIKQSGVANEDLVNRLYRLIVQNYPLVGDINSDGKVDVRDATAIQKELAGLEVADE